jgi:flagellar hook protein FlgE
LLDVIRRDGTDTYENLFAEEGVLRFTGRKGGRTLTTKEFDVTATTTVQEFINFMEQSLGIQENTDPTNPIPQSLTDTGTIDPGGTVTTDGRIQLVGNNGVANAIDITLSGFQFAGNSGTVSNVNLPFGEVQQARGEGAVADFVVYDSLGIPVQVRLTAVQESRTDTETVYRWFADSPDNQPATGVNIAVGTGLIVFDGEGKVIDVTNDTVAIDRRDVSSASPLEFALDFTQISGLAVATSSLAASRQDGSPPGTLSSFIIGEDGTLRGVFSNGVTRDLGQILLARFANPTGLQQKGENLFAAGVNSGLPIMANPGEQGIGRIIAGAVELSNTDIGGNLIDLILASTQYRSNARVIDAAQRLLDELLNLRR